MSTTASMTGRGDHHSSGLPSAMIRPLCLRVCVTLRLANYCRPACLGRWFADGEGIVPDHRCTQDVTGGVNTRSKTAVPGGMERASMPSRSDSVSLTSQP